MLTNLTKLVSVNLPYRIIGSSVFLSTKCLSLLPDFIFGHLYSFTCWFVIVVLNTKLLCTSFNAYHFFQFFDMSFNKLYF